MGFRHVGMAVMILAMVCGGVSCHRDEPPTAAASPEKKEASPGAQAGKDIPGRPGEKMPRYRSGPPRSSKMKFGGDVPSAADPASPVSASHRVSKYASGQMPAPGQPPPVKTLAAPTPEQSQSGGSLIERAKAAKSKEDFEQILDEAAGMTHEGLIPLVGALLGSSDPDVQGRALALLEGVDSEEAVPAIKQGLASTDEDVRLEALEVAKSVKSAQTASLLSGALTDGDKDVRQAAFAAAMQQEGASRDQLVAAATTSPYADLAIAALSVVRSESRKATMPLMIAALGHSNPLVRDLAHETLFLNFQNDLKTPAEATQWWNAHQALFDDNLGLKDPATLDLILPKN